MNLSGVRVLVTGAGSGVGQGIIKSLNISNLPVTVIAADISPMNVALYRTQEAIIMPRVEDTHALPIIVSLLKNNKIDVVMIGSEFDLHFFATNKEEIELQANVIIVVASPTTINISEDKWLTAEFLRQNNLPYAESYLPSDLDDVLQRSRDWGYPVVLKTRCGTSSRHVHVVHNSSEMKKLFNETPNPMLQKLIDKPSVELGSEFTCSVFKDRMGNPFGPFTARRTVRGGTSWHIEVGHFEQLYDSLLEIAKSLDFIGSLNIQLMLTDTGLIPFELNARFSGTTAIRSHFGFNEPEMSLLTFFYKQDLNVPRIRSGLVLRYNEEVFIDNISSDMLEPEVHMGTVRSWF